MSSSSPDLTLPPAAFMPSCSSDFTSLAKMTYFLHFPAEDLRPEKLGAVHLLLSEAPWGQLPVHLADGSHGRCHGRLSRAQAPAFQEQRGQRESPCIPAGMALGAEPCLTSTTYWLDDVRSLDFSKFQSPYLQKQEVTAIPTTRTKCSKSFKRTTILMLTSL